MAAITGLHIASKLAPTINKLVFRQLLTTTVMTPILRPILLAKLRACSWRDRGLLNEFFDAGFRREHAALEQLLTAPDAAWPAYVDHGWLMRALNTSEPSEREKLLIWYCAAFELWRRALSGDYPELLQFAHGET